VNAMARSMSITDTVAVALSVPAVAVTVVLPAEIAVTLPSLLPTVAMAGSPDDHSNDEFVVRPAESYARAVRRSAPPTMRLNPDGEMERPTGGPTGGGPTGGSDGGAVSSVVPPQAIRVIAAKTRDPCSGRRTQALRRRLDTVYLPRVAADLARPASDARLAELAATVQQCGHDATRRLRCRLLSVIWAVTLAVAPKGRRNSA